MKNTTYWERVSEIVSIIIKSDAANRIDLLDKYCGKKADLRWNVERAISEFEASGTTGFEHVQELMSEALEDSRESKFLKREGQAVDHFYIKKMLGFGAQGVVYQAWDNQLKRDVALKFMATREQKQLPSQSMHRQEAIKIASVKSPYICEVYSLHTDKEDTPFFAMELVQGKPLDELMRERSIPVEEATEIYRQLCEALKAVHNKRYVHQDIKPSNIMWDDANWELKLMDFGIARLQQRLQGGIVAGTPPYMSPEQIQGKQVDSRSDIWAAGILMYELFSGEHPFRGEGTVSLKELTDSITSEAPTPPLPVAPAFSSTLKRIVGRSLEKDPTSRFFSVDEIIRLLEQHRAAPGRRKILFRTLASVASVLAMVALAWFTDARQWMGRFFNPPGIGIVIEESVMPASVQTRNAQQFASSTISYTLKNLLVGDDKNWRWIPPQATQSLSREEAQSQLGMSHAFHIAADERDDEMHLVIDLLQFDRPDLIKSVELKFDETRSTQSQLIRGITDVLEIPISDAQLMRLIYGSFDNSEAFDLYRNAADRIANNPDVENVNAAIRLLDYSLELDSTLTPARSTLARAYLYKAYLTKDPTFYTASDSVLSTMHGQNEMAIVESERSAVEARQHALAGRYEQALADINLAVTLNPQHVQFYIDRAEILEAWGQLERAELALKDGLTLDPDHTAVQLALGLFLYRRTRFPESETLFQSILESEPRNKRAISNLAALYLAQGMFHQAVPFLELASTIEADHSIHSNLGIAYWQTDRRERAVEQFEKALSYSDDDYRVWNNLGSVLDELEDPRAQPTYQTALKMAEAFQQVSPNDAGLLADLPWLYHDTGDPAKACRQIEVARRHNLWDTHPAHGAKLDQLLPLINC